MINVKLSVRPVLADIFLRQTSNGSGIWGDCRFLVNTPVERCDWWVVCHNSGLVETETVICDPAHIVYVSLEPDDSWFSKAFLDQFSHLVLCDRSVKHPAVTYKNGLNWWIGISVEFKSNGAHQFTPHFTLDYDRLSAMTCTEKNRFMSVICSNKAIWSGHRKRMTFLDRLRSHPVSRHIDFFGGGANPVDDKWNAIAPYKYHLVLENSIVPDYWSEKLADSYLGFAYPVYYGCPNIHDYFSHDALRVIDIENFDRTIAVIEELLNDDRYEERLPVINVARDKVLNDYNLFQLMSEICDRPAEHQVQCQLNPRASFDPLKPEGSILNRFTRKMCHGYRVFRDNIGKRFD